MERNQTKPKRNAGPRRAALRTGLGGVSYEERRAQFKAPKGIPRAERGSGQARQSQRQLYPEELKYRGIKHGESVVSPQVIHSCMLGSFSFGKGMDRLRSRASLLEHAVA